MSAPRVSFVSLGCPKALVVPSASSRACAPKAMRSPANMTAPISSSSTPAASSIRPRRNRSRRSAPRMAENGKVIVTGCMGAEPEQIRDRFPNVLAITGPQAYESVMAAVQQAALPSRDPYIDLLPPQGVEADAAPLRLSARFRKAATTAAPSASSRAAWRSRFPAGRRCAARGRKTGQGRRRSCSSSRRTPVPTASISNTRRPCSAIVKCARSSSIAPRTGQARHRGCECTMSTPTRMSPTSSR